MVKIKNHYATLGVSPGATTRDILRARNRLLKKYHPDLNPGKKDAKEKTIEIVLAAEVLLNEHTREQYDKAYRNIFSPAAEKEKAPPKPPEEPPAVRHTIIITCAHCGRKNVHPRKNYCMYCGAGIGNNPKSFSFDDISKDILNHVRPRKDFTVWQNLSREFKWYAVILIVSPFIGLVFALLHSFFDIGSGIRWHEHFITGWVLGTAVTFSSWLILFWLFDWPSD